MPLTVYDHNEQTTSGTTVHTLATITTLGVYELWLDLGNLAAGATPDILQVVGTVKVRTGNTARNAFIPRRFVGGRILVPDWKSIPISAETELIFTIQMVQGSNRAIPWKIYKAA